MGVSGLLPLLKSIQKPCSLKKFSGQTIGVDAYGWLHRGTIACAIELAQGKPTSKWLNFVMSRVNMLVHFGIKPYLVFDGDYLPSKSLTEKDRAGRRRESRKTGLELLRLGKTSQAHLELQKSIDVTPEMARQLIDELKKSKIDYVVAPYEADAQMVYLEKRGIIQAILSEDSDLLVFGAKCLLTKLDQYGDCIMINRDDFTACRDISLVGWSDSEFRVMSILSGCDYLASIDKMGLKTAYRLIRKHKTVERIVRAVQFDGKMKVPSGYLESFNRAEATFLYQWVYCPEARCLVNFSQPGVDVNLDDFPCIGKYVDADIATGVAKGDLHPHTKQPIVLAPEVRSATRAPLRASSSFQTPDLKKHKSIESFFKRTPLAELDPNSFTPSPSQRQLLQQSPASWSAEPITRRSFVTRDSPAVPSTAPHPPRRAVTDVLPLSHQSPKRVRLCSDGNYAVPTSATHRTETGSSKFFGPKSSPSLSRGKSGSRGVSNEFNLWSDDSVEEAMSQLADHPISPKIKPNKKLAVFNDSSTGDVCDETLADSSASTMETQSTLTSEERSQASFTSTSSSGSGIKVKLSEFEFLSTPKRAQTMDPMKRIRADPLPAGKESREADPNATSHEPQDQSDTNITEDMDKESSGRALDEPDGKAADKQHMAKIDDEPLAATEQLDEPAPKGSEDLIVPDSEGEEDEEQSLEVKSTKHTGFNFDLGRFAFAG